MFPSNNLSQIDQTQTKRILLWIKLPNEMFHWNQYEPYRVLDVCWEEERQDDNESEQL